ncbi:MAG: hypothetical protein AB8H79_24225 [Myxococcota bacterium]
MNRRWSTWLLLGAVALSIAAGPRRTYEKELRTWTDELKIYRGFDTALIMRATYLDGPMRASLAQERRRLMNPTPEDHAEFVTRMQTDGAAYHDVVFSAQTPLPAATTFGEADSGWVVWLEADGTREKLVSIERIRKPSPLHRELYAHLNVWSELWIARFEKTVSTPNTVVLHVGSGYGNGDLEWSKLGADR